jgi:hypothetical protein
MKKEKLKLNFIKMDIRIFKKQKKLIMMIMILSKTTFLNNCDFYNINTKTISNDTIGSYLQFKLFEL